MSAAVLDTLAAHLETAGVTDGSPAALRSAGDAVAASPMGVSLPPAPAGLTGALQFTTRAADRCRTKARDLANRAASLADDDPDDPEIPRLRAAADLLDQAAGALDAAHGELARQVPVAEAYRTQPGAGTKWFLLT